MCFRTLPKISTLCVNPKLQHWVSLIVASIIKEPVGLIVFSLDKLIIVLNMKYQCHGVLLSKCLFNFYSDAVKLRDNTAGQCRQCMLIMR